MAMAVSIPLHTFRKISFFPLKGHASFSPRTVFTPSAKFDLSELMGGRGLCNGEEGIQKELKRPFGGEAPSPAPPSSTPAQSPPSAFQVGEGAFEKELLGLTGGFPGGEKGLKRFIQENPPPPQSKDVRELGIQLVGSKPDPPQLPLFMPGMIVIVKNPNNPFYMYTGIVQRVTDGMVGVLFEGGNWDKLLTFRLDELERRDKGPPMVNPKSAVLESLVESFKE
ncbi:hypothetical protein J5N97_015526 [Dioscorea zingiberensis]|uniref:Chlororespiratory reduction31 n=1 Tax=Dioscorea zingiberensis TaxID=325984 RepID=A0A9D5CWP3_9LILI|nr:hypothetical protein J5N97_015526 [Dioscorea zingiberensis]